MRVGVYRDAAGRGMAIVDANGVHRGLCESDAGYPGGIEALIGLDAAGLAAVAATLAAGTPIDPAAVEWLPPLARPGKIVCVGLNYADHTAESGFQQPDYPTLFARFATTLVGHGAPVVRPRVSEQFDYEGELVAIIGKGGRHIPRETALDHVFGWSIFNDVSVRDYQFKSPQWTMGKNFDATGAFGPLLVTADELPPGGRGLTLETRLNGTVVQHASTDDLIFDVASLIAVVSEGITLEPGDLIVTGTPSGVGAARKPPLWMKPGDLCEVEIEGLGILANRVVDEVG
jgi:2-keto-4-pentenoate hydratase/2-oxohepta-3-ene-1,7-dioic acid hydratase in catechol pathway